MKWFYIKGYNRTLINKSSSNETNGDKPNQDAFMSALEVDAQERFERRKLNEKISNELKVKGNAEFSKGNYEKAIEHYTEVWNKANKVFSNSQQNFIFKW